MSFRIVVRGRVDGVRYDIRGYEDATYGRVLSLVMDDGGGLETGSVAEAKQRAWGTTREYFAVDAREQEVRGFFMLHQSGRPSKACRLSLRRDQAGVYLLGIHERGYRRRVNDIDEYHRIEIVPSDAEEWRYSVDFT